MPLNDKYLSQFQRTREKGIMENTDIHDNVIFLQFISYLQVLLTDIYQAKWDAIDPDISDMMPKGSSWWRWLTKHNTKY